MNLMGTKKHARSQTRLTQIVYVGGSFVAQRQRKGSPVQVSSPVTVRVCFDLEKRKYWAKLIAARITPLVCDVMLGETKSAENVGRFGLLVYSANVMFEGKWRPVDFGKDGVLVRIESCPS